MASSLEYVEYIIDQLSEANITYRKMFGEYGIYYNGKYIAAVCDDKFLVKITEAGKELIPEYKTEVPYEGGKPMLYIEDLHDRELLKQLMIVTWAELPPRKKKNG